MLVTTKKAGELWCPMARIVEVGDGFLSGPFNRYHSGADVGAANENEARCLADKCMMWVWQDGPYTPSSGYCGLIGKTNH